MKNALRRHANQPKAADKITIEPGAEKRLANILKKALNTPPPRSVQKPKATKKRR